MGSQELRIILDDNAGDIRYNSGQWILSSVVQWYRGTSNYPVYIANGVFGSLNLTFEGTSVAFIGNTPSPDASQFATVSIDGEAAYNASYGSRNVPQSYIQWYQSPLLEDGQHTITMDNLNGTAIDIVIITVGPTTLLANKAVFVDNDDPAIQYIGKWTENANRFEAGSLPDGFPVGNTTRRSTTVGDMMTFRFSGTSISIYGIFSWANIGGISVAYTLDGIVEIQSYPVTINAPQYISADGEATNFLFFEMDSIPAGDHALVMNITDIQNQTFIFDYLVYSPSFSSLATMPNLTNLTMATTTKSESGTSITSTDSDSSAAMHTAAGDSHISHKINGISVGTVVGGVVGSALAVGLAIIMFVYLRKKYPKGNQSLRAERIFARSTHNNPYHQVSGLPMIRPNFGRSASSREGITPFLITSTSMELASVYDYKRNRLVQELRKGDSTPPNSPARSHSTSLDTMQRNISPSNSNTPQTVDIDQSMPPAYDALSMHLDS